MRSLRVSALVAILTAASSVAYAAPIHYLESISGDSSGIGPLVVLDFGDNTISGTAGWAANPDFDIFRVSVPAGGVLTFLDYAFFTTGTATAAMMQWYLNDPALAFLGSQDINVIGFSPSVSFLPGVFPLQTGTYILELSGFSKDIGSATFSTDYTWTLNVAPTAVPEPGTLGMLSIGLAYGARWFRRHEQGR